MSRNGLAFLLLSTLHVLMGSSRVAAASVLMVSVDGMKPGYVLEADAHGLKIPFLRGLLHDGAYARGVTGVWPTVTYPSHTTLITGVNPAQHGIVNNLEFDPKHQFAQSWFWYAGLIRVPTLWQATHGAGLRTASVGWPASVGAMGVDVLIPEYWRSSPSTEPNPFDTDLLSALSLPPGMLPEMQGRLGSYMTGNDPGPAGDAIKTRFALDILRRYKPTFMTVHLSSLDEEEHAHGPFSVQANQDLELIDEWLAQLFAAARDADPGAIVLVVSDHGFLTVTHRLNLLLPFIGADLVQANGAWQAQPWTAGGMAAIMLREPKNEVILAQVRTLLHGVQQDSANGIADILERGAIAQRGAFPDASFLVVMKPGYALIADATSPLLSEVHGTQGSHGFSPDYVEMQAAFFAAGRGIAAHRDLGIIDMRSIAPSVAQLLNVRLAEALMPPLPLRP